MQFQWLLIVKENYSADEDKRKYRRASKKNVHFILDDSNVPIIKFSDTHMKPTPGRAAAQNSNTDGEILYAVASV